MQDDPDDADVLSDLDQDGAGSENGEQEEEDGFIVCDGYLSADEVCAGGVRGIAQTLLPFFEPHILAPHFN